MIRREYVYVTSCVDWGGISPTAGSDIRDLVDSEKDITRKTFLRHAELGDLPEELGYSRHASQGLTMARDWYIGYYKGVFRGVPAYFFRWSAIEYVFVPRDRVDELFENVRRQIDEPVSR